MNPAPDQNLFRTEYDLELESWLRRRFRLVCTLLLAMTGVVAVVRILIIAAGDAEMRLATIMITVAAAAATGGTVAHYFFARHWHTADRAELLRGTSNMILMLGAISLVKGLAVHYISPEQASDFVLPLFLMHLMACLFLPWTPMESVRPILPLLALWALGVLLLGTGGLGSRITQVALSPGILIPGVAICYLRLKSHSESFRTRMVGEHFLSMRQEFSKARSIHESMFPRPHDDGCVRFEYTYTPMRELGGDYVHLHVTDEGLLHLTLIDVTGHGLPAALTVNRLFGELERIRGESPLAEPGEVLTLLNRYVHLTMSRHNIFVTALCLTLDPNIGRLHWANAGHPPAFLRGANGVVTRLPATTMLLRAVDGREFQADPKVKELSPGDVIVVYTDGVFEARDRLGEQLGLDRLDQLLHTNPPPRSWPGFVSQAVQKHSKGRNDDDILIASLTFLAPRPQQVLARPEMASS